MPRTPVFGAAGFIGSHVARLLVQRVDEVHVTVRPDSSLPGCAVSWYRERGEDRLAARGSRQPLVLRATGGVLRPVGLGWSADRAQPYPQALMATLYRCHTPTDWLCPCGRVARALKRREIAFEAVAVPQRRSRRAEVETLSGQRRVPTLVLDGEIICDSRRIVEHLDHCRR